MAVVLTAAGALIATAGCSAASGTAPGALTDPDIVVAAVPATGATGLYIAEDQGLFSKAGLHVAIRPAFSAAGTVTDLFKGKVDVTFGQWTTALALEPRESRCGRSRRGMRAAPAWRS